MFSCDSEPAVPVLASNEIRVFVELVSQEQGPFDVHAGTGQRVALGEGSAYLMSRPDNRFVNRDPRFVDNSHQLKEELALRILHSEHFGTVERTWG